VAGRGGGEEYADRRARATQTCLPTAQAAAAAVGVTRHQRPLGGRPQREWRPARPRVGSAPPPAAARRSTRVPREPAAQSRVPRATLGSWRGPPRRAPRRAAQPPPALGAATMQGAAAAQKRGGTRAASTAATRPWACRCCQSQRDEGGGGRRPLPTWTAASREAPARLQLRLLLQRGRRVRQPAAPRTRPSPSPAPAARTA
jgi:hypothetical protein